MEGAGPAADLLGIDCTGETSGATSVETSEEVSGKVSGEISGLVSGSEVSESRWARSSGTD